MTLRKAPDAEVGAVSIYDIRQTDLPISFVQNAYVDPPLEGAPIVWWIGRVAAKEGELEHIVTVMAFWKRKHDVPTWRVRVHLQDGPVTLRCEWETPPMRPLEFSIQFPTILRRIHQMEEFYKARGY